MQKEANSYNITYKYTIIFILYQIEFISTTFKLAFRRRGRVQKSSKKWHLEIMCWAERNVLQKIHHSFGLKKKEKCAENSINSHRDLELCAKKFQKESKTGTDRSQRIDEIKVLLRTRPKSGISRRLRDVCIASDTIVRKGYLICKYLYIRTTML